mgnify:CR=1 FL=1
MRTMNANKGHVSLNAVAGAGQCLHLGLSRELHAELHSGLQHDLEPEARAVLREPMRHASTSCIIDSSRETHILPRAARCAHRLIDSKTTIAKLTGGYIRVLDSASRLPNVAADLSKT